MDGLVTGKRALWAGRLFLWLWSYTAFGCSLLRGVEVDSVATSVQKPSNVALYVSVLDGKNPVSSLMVENFKVFENEQLVPTDQSQLTLLDRDLAAVHHTLVLVDMSQSKDDESKRLIARAVAGFVARTRADQAVTVYAFDGSPDLALIGEFPRAVATPEALEELAPLRSYAVRDPSRNLYGALGQGLKELDTRLMQGQKPVRIGTLVVFTRGPDVAGRSNEEQVRDLLDQTPHHVVSVGVGETEGDYYLDDIGRAGVIRAQAANTVGVALEEAATKVSSLYDMYYLVSYCSPARAGARRLRLEVAFSTPEGDEKTGDVEQDFDANGFGPGCDPTTPPRFVVNTGQGVPSVTVPESTPAPATPSAPKTQPSATPEAEPESPEPEGDEIVPPPPKPGYAPQR
jgi:hypothetical protein